MDMSEKADLVQRRRRAAKQVGVRQQKTGVIDMFSIEPQAEPVDGRCSSDVVDAFWQRNLAAGDRRIRRHP